MDKLDVIIESIVRHQENVVGPLAIEQANEVDGVLVTDDGKVRVTLKKTSSPKKVLESLVKRYEMLFGQASVEVCKDAIKEAGVKIDAKELPEILS
ncbi:hypothetical protein A3D08_01605 [Candidatus Roizmanbacteria bacterium RIFCSPHIGHO2_02_FULL_43_11]|uniref:Uncharacterized protein n=1 Tax=Candidatus Roizmanbacteria bacterium RIFCSPHIGHO2_02_FULL_43_11 TaxID=1802043 RepID=A0A1F7HLH2_9BACT|nr:MAG: hypothetical protein A3D08_01605 [Candidatus Roizmanbacteria bacterium RIFCSPHIGHO2_02_FULL_43_11]